MFYTSEVGFAGSGRSMSGRRWSEIRSDPMERSSACTVSLVLSHGQVCQISGFSAEVFWHLRISGFSDFQVAKAKK